MKRKASDITDNLYASADNPPDELYIKLGKNALSTLNNIPTYSKNWIPILGALGDGIPTHELAPFLEHGTKDNVNKSPKTSNEIKTNILFENKVQKKEQRHVKEKEKIEAKDFIVHHTREQRL